MKQIGFKVSIEEANLILEGLGHLPFAQVYRLVEKLQGQASEQMKEEVQADSPSVPVFSEPHVADAKNGNANGR
jgi:hypothetical protein